MNKISSPISSFDSVINLSSIHMLLGHKFNIYVFFTHIVRLNSVKHYYRDLTKFSFQKIEIVQWVNEGGGMIMDDETWESADFTVECHGSVPKSVTATRTISVSSHWIMCCLKV